MAAAMRSLLVLASALVAAVGCSTLTAAPDGYGGGSTAAVGSNGGGGGATMSTTTTTGTVSFSGDGGTSTLPIIPETCTPDDAGCAGLTGVEYQCPGDTDASAPVNCPSDPQNGTGPALYCCSNLCTQGCADLPCPSEPCPAAATLLVTCGPAMPDIEPGCTLIATRPAAQGLGQRFSFCCPSL
jgi:hypothetical protein